MEVLSNGMQVKFWIPVEEEPDIDRFVDEQIMIDMDRFMLVGTLVKVNTCKKKNDEKEFEYFKQLTISVMNICSAENNNVNISVPTGKEEFLYEVKFRYAPEPQQLEEDGDMEVGQDIDSTPDEAGTDADAEFSEYMDGMAKKETEQDQETLTGAGAAEEEPKTVADEFGEEITGISDSFDPDNNPDTESDKTPETPEDTADEPDNEPDNEDFESMLDGPDDFGEQDADETTPVVVEKVTPEQKKFDSDRTTVTIKEKPAAIEEDDGIDWGE